MSYSMTLTSVGNPDFRQYAPVSNPKTVKGKTLAAMKKHAEAYIDYWALGGGNWTNPVVMEGDKVIGFFNHGLKLFEGRPPKTWKLWKNLKEIKIED